MRKLIYLPIEIKVRELNSKLLLAIRLVELGNSVVICRREFADNLKNKPNGVVLAKSIAGFEIDNIKKHKKHGNLYTSLDIEGIFISNREQSFRISQETINEVDMLFLNGEKELIRIKETNFQLDESKIMLTGAPQFDFYKHPLYKFFKHNSSKYKADYGNYILVLSRFGDSNSKFKRKDKDLGDFYNKQLGLNMSCDVLNFYNSSEKHTDKLFNAFLEMLPVLSANFPNSKIIVRPHPVEKIETWIEYSKGLNNVKVIFEGEVGNWIQGAEFVIHNGCTTAIESYFLGKPIISYMPYTSEEFDLHIANMTGAMCNNLEELISTCKLILDKKFERINVDIELKKYIYNLDVNASELLAENLTILTKSIKNSNGGKFNSNLFLIGFKKYVYKFRRRKSNSLIKFPYTTSNEIKERLEKICSCLEFDFTTYNVKEIGFNSFLISKK